MLTFHQLTVILDYLLYKIKSHHMAQKAKYHNEDLLSVPSACLFLHFKAECATLLLSVGADLCNNGAKLP